MVATAATCTFFPVVSPSPEPGSGKSSGKFGGGSIPASVDTRGIKSKTASSGNLQLKTNAHAPSKVNGIKVMEGRKNDDEVVSSPPPRTFINTLPDWSMLLAAMTTIFLAAEKQWMMLDWKPKRTDVLMDPFGIGRFMQDGLVFRQNFGIRSYEIGADRTASIETLMNHLQETALNHVKTAGLLDGGFGSTPEMSKRNLIWVVSKMRVIVDRYPTWGDVVQVDTWVTASGKNGMRRDWVIRDSQTEEILIRASSLWVLMNKETRKLAKLPEEVRAEISSYFVDNPLPVMDEDSRKLLKLENHSVDCMHYGLKPKWSDLDVNQHVNNVKYLGWILDTIPEHLLESHELEGLTLEYRRECLRDSVVNSLTSVVSNDNVRNLANDNYVQCQHSLQLDSGGEILRGRTDWRRKKAKNIESNNDEVLPAEEEKEST